MNDKAARSAVPDPRGWARRRVVADPNDAPAEQKIELLLPLKPDNGARGSDLLRARLGLLPTLNRFCDPAFVARLTIVAPDADLERLRDMQDDCDLPITLLGEQALLGPVPPMPRHGWYVQQMIKIAYAARCGTPWYVTLDADTFLVDFLDARLFDGDRAPAHLERPEAHPGWWAASAEALHARPVTDTKGEEVLGVTPAFLSAEIMRRVIDRLSRIAAARRQGWTAYLAGLTSEQDRCWTEYALYWTTLVNTDTPDLLHYPRDTYVFCHALSDAKARIRGGAHGQQALFGVLQSSFVGDAAYAGYIGQMLRLTEPDRDPRRPLGLHGGYRYLDPLHLRALLRAGGPVWCVSASATADPLFQALGAGARPATALIARFPRPPRLDRPGFRALYVIDDPAATLAAALAGRQEDISKNNNINFSPVFWEDLSFEEYFAAGEDLLNLIDHVRNWTDPDGMLRNADYPVLILRLSALPQHIETVLQFVEIEEKLRPSIRRRLRALRPAPVDPDLASWCADLYGGLAAYIAAFPGAALWDPALGTLLSLDPPARGKKPS